MMKTRKWLFAPAAVILSLSLAGGGCLSARDRAAHELAAFNMVQTISKSQLIYKLTKGKGQYTDLKTLIAEGLVDVDLVGEKYGYLFATTPVVVEGERPMFDVTAKPKSSSTGSRSFYSNESLSPTVWAADGREPPVATASDRVPKNGTAVQ